jgi:hypothetical protein
MKKIVIEEKGYIKARLHPEVLKELLMSLKLEDRSSKPPMDKKLAGNIEAEFGVDHLIPNSFYENVSFLANNYYKEFPFERLSTNKKFEFITTWLNYQKKHEFNPIHHHDGSLSFVVWLKIPYNLKDELSLPNNSKSNFPANSLFEFVTPDTTHLIHVDSSMEGEIIIFNSRLRHCVYPFYTSDEFRISLAGNLRTIWLPKN